MPAQEITAKQARSFDLAAPPAGFVDDPFPWYDALLTHAPVLPQPDGSILVSRHADLERIYKDTTLYSSDKKVAFAPKFGAGSPLYEHHTTSLVFSDPPLHTRVRKIMTSALTPRAIARMEPGLVNTVDHLLDRMAGKANVDLIEDFASSIPIQIIGNLLDVPMEERGPLRDWSLAILGALEPTLTDDQLKRGHDSVTEFKAYLVDLVARRRANPGDPETDVLTRLIRGEGADGQLSEIELLQNCIFILNAGHETTTNLIGNGLALLNDHPDQRARLLEQPDLINPAIEEFLRYASPNQLGNRETTQDIEIDGVPAPKGTNLHLVIGAANRDPAMFDEPGHFDISRKPNRHLAFAGGPHVCVGLTLARLEGRIAIGRLLDRFPGYRLTDGRELGGRMRFRGYAKLPAVMG
ncbi:cytochrome P450 [Lutimaribacter sp. EGI FJ00015]|uniref:Cytochrome P450 n=1 Tax=Lutimaribacter degradans TaxID=2945989 RepID=A0ACC5ZXV1_9RHOB|nr:cytochrome P450 [Lutimaribacter sp. EGI FJ00013]MCM2563167.1 cytochrome P450 [Lutimaribacter sp. EGI FJ00013]MCO0614346.1 cytochrome P450 [Lutimaribacter sp. EGI FJ00015]MCO0637156.1 cytochrome P450 [Lutimaribacter sp. EGI FJ00014]